MLLNGNGHHRNAPGPYLSVLAVVLVVVTLLGSVAIPAFLTRRISARLDQITAMVEQARIGSLAPSDAATLRTDMAVHVAHVRRLESLSLAVNAILVIVALGAVLAVVLLTRSERRLAAEKLRLLDEARERRRQLEHVLQVRSRLMRGFSHDVKNPLGAADGYASLLTLGVHGALAPAQLQSVERIHRCIQSALALIGDLHQLSRAETGNLVMTMRPVDAGDLIRASAEDYLGTAAAKRLELKTEVQDGLPLIITDADRVREILNNLVSNAIKYTAQGTVTLRARRDNAPGDGLPDAVLVEVSDTGRGIPSGMTGHIFEEFSRLATDQAGAGLGLAISKLLAEALGARLSVASEVGRGSTFTLRLPIAAAEGVREAEGELVLT